MNGRPRLFTFFCKDIADMADAIAVDIVVVVVVRVAVLNAAAAAAAAASATPVPLTGVVQSCPALMASSRDQSPTPRYHKSVARFLFFLFGGKGERRWRGKTNYFLPRENVR